MFLFGTRFFGRVDEVPGVCHVATRFVHFARVPLVPVGSAIVLDGAERGPVRTVPIPLARKSVLAAYLRAAVFLAGAASVLLAGLSALALAAGGRAAGSPPDASAAGEPLAGGWLPAAALPRDLATVVLLIALGAGAFIVLRLSHRILRPSERERARILAHIGLPADAGPARRSVRSEHLIVGRGVEFERFAASLGQLGFSLGAQPEAEPGGEPAIAEWAGADGLHVTWFVDPESALRLVEVTGGRTEQVVSELRDVARVSFVGNREVFAMLESDNPEVLVVGLNAASWVGVNGEGRRYADHVARLASHPDPRVAELARTVHPSLVA